MPLIGATLDALFAQLLQLSAGGQRSCIAVPAVVAIALPKANQGLSITSSLAITFPVNVLVGVSLYSALIIEVMV